MSIILPELRTLNKIYSVPFEDILLCPLPAEVGSIFPTSDIRTRSFFQWGSVKCRLIASLFLITLKKGLIDLQFRSSKALPCRHCSSRIALSGYCWIWTLFTKTPIASPQLLCKRGYGFKLFNIHWPTEPF